MSGLNRPQINKIITRNLKSIDRDFTLYVNYPFCVRRCRFCIYHIGKYSKGNSDIFLAYYKKEIRLYAEKLGNIKFRNLHIGGGTPNLVAPELLIGPLAELVDFGKIDNFVIEVSPSADLRAYVNQLKKFNPTKVMLGIQALDERILKGESRFVPLRLMHDNMEMLSGSGLSWSVDLIYGLDSHGFTRNYISEIEGILKYRPSGFHLYNIRSQPENDFYHKKIRSQKRLKFIDKFDFGQINDILRSNGYELIGDEWCSVSDKKNIRLAKKAARDYHESDAIGLGLGGRSRWDRIRYANTKNLDEYSSLLNKKKFPVKRFFDYGKELYLVGEFLMEINESSGFNLQKALLSDRYSDKEKSGLQKLLVHLRKAEIGLLEHGQKILIPQKSWTKCIRGVEEYLKEKGGREYFYKN